MNRKLKITDEEEISLNNGSNVLHSYAIEKGCYQFYYNVECVWGDGKVETFNAKLEHVGKDGFYFIFKGGLIKIPQSRVIMMMAGRRASGLFE